MAVQTPPLLLQQSFSVKETPSEQRSNGTANVGLAIFSSDKTIPSGALQLYNKLVYGVSSKEFSPYRVNICPDKALSVSGVADEFDECP